MSGNRENHVSTTGPSRDLTLPAHHPPPAPVLLTTPTTQVGRSGTPPRGSTHRAHSRCGKAERIKKRLLNHRAPAQNFQGFRHPGLSGFSGHLRVEFPRYQSATHSMAFPAMVHRAVRTRRPAACCPRSRWRTPCCRRESHRPSARAPPFPTAPRWAGACPTRAQ